MEGGDKLVRWLTMTLIKERERECEKDEPHNIGPQSERTKFFTLYSLFFLEGLELGQMQI